MKVFRLTLILGILMFYNGSIVSQSCGKKNTTQLLSQEMLDFFLKTLCDNYYESDTIASFFEFVDDYKNSIMPSDYSEPIPFNIKVNTQQFKRINKKLFIRDYCHYYYFYMDYIGDFSMQFKEKLVAFRNKYPFLARNISLSDSSYKIDYSSYSNPVIWVNVEKGSFLYHNGDFFEDVLNMAKATGGLYSLYQFSCALYKGGGNIDLSDRDIQTVAAVFYWKVLCQQAEVDFHKPLKTQEWKRDLDVIIEIH